jgi:hypothetical protein
MILLSLKDDVNVLQKVKSKKLIFLLAYSKPLTKREGSGYGSLGYGYSDPDMYQNVRDPQHWILLARINLDTSSLHSSIFIFSLHIFSVLKMLRDRKRKILAGPPLPSAHPRNPPFPKICILHCPRGRFRPIWCQLPIFGFFLSLVFV